MKILVLGGAGYIGSRTVYALAEKGIETVVVDDLSTGFRAAVHPDAAFYQGDIRDGAFLESVLSREPDIGAAIHFAACSQVGESMRDPLKYYQNNLGGTASLLQALVRHGIGKVVFSSTAAVYGAPRSVPIAEGDPTVPENVYGETKLAVERMFRWVERAHGLRFVALRYFNAAGAHENGRIGEAHRPESHLIPLVLQAAAGQRPGVSVFGTDYPTPDGTCVRDYVHVSDLADAHLRAVDYLADGGRSDVFNLGTGTGCSVLEIVRAAEKVTGAAIPVTFAPRRPGDPPVLVASGEKARRVLDWQPRCTDAESIIASAWAFHKTHPNGYEE